MTIAEERIERLETLASAAASEGRHDLAREYAATAERLAERHRLSLPRTFARRICDECGAFLRPGDNARVRVRDGFTVVTCDCGAHHRYGYD